jgi:hypothetical protein
LFFTQTFKELASPPTVFALGSPDESNHCFVHLNNFFGFIMVGVRWPSSAAATAIPLIISLTLLSCATTPSGVPGLWIIHSSSNRTHVCFSSFICTRTSHLMLCPRSALAPETCHFQFLEFGLRWRLKQGKRRGSLWPMRMLEALVDEVEVAAAKQLGSKGQLQLNKGL